MDGVFVAYHNTARIFGFQYVPLVEMDQRLFGEAPGVGDRVFQKCMETLELVSEEIISCFPGQVRVFDTVSLGCSILRPTSPSNVLLKQKTA